MHSLRHVVRRTSFISARPDENVLEVAAKMTRARIGALPVLDGECLVGMFSERDLMTRVLVAGRDPQQTCVESVMTREVVTADIEETRSESLEKMYRAGCRHLPVLLDGRVVAMLSLRDLLRDEIEEQSEEIRDLRAYLHQSPL